MKKDHDRVPLRPTHNTKKRYGKHREGAVPLTIWEDREFKELLKEDAASVELPKWSLSDHVSFILRDHLGMWDKPYRPYPKKPTCEAPSGRALSHYCHVSFDAMMETLQAYADWLFGLGLDQASSKKVLRQRAPVARDLGHNTI